MNIGTPGNRAQGEEWWVSGLAEALRGPGWVALHHGQPGGQSRSQRQFCPDTAGQVAWGRVLLRPRLSSVVSREEEPTRSCTWGASREHEGWGGGAWSREPRGQGRSPAGLPLGPGRGHRRAAQGGPRRPGRGQSLKSGSWGSFRPAFLRASWAGFVCFCPSARRGGPL